MWHWYPFLGIIVISDQFKTQSVQEIYTKATTISLISLIYIERYDSVSIGHSLKVACTVKP